MLHYRANVALILTRPDGLVLLCERASFDGSWQFPQGGAKEGENSAAALAREVEEEISLAPSDYKILEEKGPYRYEFRHGFRKEGCDGQEQTYFLAEIEPTAIDKIRVDQEEFQSFRWLAPKDFRIAWVPPIKRAVYRAVFHDFFGVSID
jgi:putative (di)nucleoside polyphosphate hydrolase